MNEVFIMNRKYEKGSQNVSLRQCLFVLGRKNSDFIRLEQIKDGIQKEMFNESLLKFEKQKSFDSNVIGKIVRQNIELYFLENIENMRELDFISKTECTRFFPLLQPFKSNTFLLLYLEKNVLIYFALIEMAILYSIRKI